MKGLHEEPREDFPHLWADACPVPHAVSGCGTEEATHSTPKVSGEKEDYQNFHFLLLKIKTSKALMLFSQINCL